MPPPLRPHWRNCALHADSEIIAIDAMEDRIAPVAENITKIRELITGLELCHHKAERWVYNIIEAIGSGETSKGLGSRAPGQHHPRETVWQNAYDALSAWCAGTPINEINLAIDTIPASRLLAPLGERSPLKVWQVQRVVERIGSYLHWPHSYSDPATQYTLLLFSASEYEAVYLDECPERYRDHEEIWQTTARTFIHDRENGGKTDLSLAIAIDMLWPCHWQFVENLQIVLEAIGGKLDAAMPFAACGHNINRVPIRQRMELIIHTLKVFCGNAESGQEVDNDLLALLGGATEEKQWLAASLEKTIRLQLNPPSDLKAFATLNGPEWIKQP
jgi:hypothetical protein